MDAEMEVQEYDHDEIVEVEESAASWKTEDYNGGSPSNLLHWEYSKSSSNKPLFQKGGDLEKKSKMMKMPTEEDKYDWLRSQLFGVGLEIDTPFGKRILTYADHTASGRSLNYVEAFIMESVLPSYGKTPQCSPSR